MWAQGTHGCENTRTPGSLALDDCFWEEHWKTACCFAVAEEMQKAERPGAWAGNGPLECKYGKTVVGESVGGLTWTEAGHMCSPVRRASLQRKEGAGKGLLMGPEQSTQGSACMCGRYSMADSCLQQVLPTWRPGCCCQKASKSFSAGCFWAIGQGVDHG